MATPAVEWPPDMANGNGKTRETRDTMPVIDTSLVEVTANEPENEAGPQLPSPSPSPAPSPTSSHAPALQTVPEYRTPSPAPTDHGTSNVAASNDDSRSVAVTDSTVSSPVGSEPGNKARSHSMSKMGSQDGSVRKLSAGQMQELLAAPESLPIGVAPEPGFTSLPVVQSPPLLQPHQSHPHHQYQQSHLNANANGRPHGLGIEQQIQNLRYPLSATAAPESSGHISKVDEKQQQQQQLSQQSFLYPPSHHQQKFPPFIARQDLHHYRRQSDLPLMLNTNLAVNTTGMDGGGGGGGRNDVRSRRLAHKSRTLSTPPTNRKSPDKEDLAAANSIKSPRRNSFQPAPRPAPLNLENPGARPPGMGIGGFGSTPGNSLPHPRAENTMRDPMQQQQAQQQHQQGQGSPIIPPLPLPPMSLPTHLQLELAGQRPSPLYIYRAQHGIDIPYESSAVKFERLKNTVLLPPYLERTLIFGALACLDAWLYTFTILPIRFFMALGVLVKWWGYVFWKEVKWVVGFVYVGLGRMWRRGRRGRSMSTRAGQKGNPGGGGWIDVMSESERSQSRARTHSNVSSVAPSVAASGVDIGENSNNLLALGRKESSTSNAHNGRPHAPSEPNTTRRRGGTGAGTFRHRRTKSIPSNLSTFNKADLLQGGVIIFSSIALMWLDGSRVLDRLLASQGQDIYECLFSSETLSRNASGRSKVLFPFLVFLGSLVYNVLHTIALFFMVITLNVAVNSYSNALLTLLLSNQFVEIKGTVFKKFEKENLFQLTCADIVERFQLWVFLVIIAMRNIVEVGGLSIPGAGSEGDPDATTTAPMHSPSILPFSFTIFPSWMLSGEVLSPFLIVIGSEMLVDWIKHVYVAKFNNVRPGLYARMLDILTKDYYSNAFVTTSTLMNRLGLPLIPLSCLFIRASFQTYHMFLATHLAPPISPTSTQTSLETLEEATPSSPAMKDALERIDKLIRNALGRSIYGAEPLANINMEGHDFDAGQGTTSQNRWINLPTSDDLIAALTMVVVFFIIFLVLLIVKLLLGMLLLRYSRARFHAMRKREIEVAKGEKERENFEMKGAKRVGGWGTVEVGEDRRRIIYEDDAAGLKRLRDKEREREKKVGKGEGDKMGSTSKLLEDIFLQVSCGLGTFLGRHSCPLRPIPVSIFAASVSIATYDHAGRKEWEQKVGRGENEKNLKIVKMPELSDREYF
ncbi:uncharacterized protein MKZ38_001713 [Zalerion maritima]|uniref:Eukaryotic membrane protein family-domain-containing protein n=1 Tax=Zalerion maritima TaxID=339359 RepID=A0AAD5WTM3_9PEZI|nr:uncharacterized protein MKZ38_001713 [Zalerion maritima]